MAARMVCDRTVDTPSNFVLVWYYKHGSKTFITRIKTLKCVLPERYYVTGLCCRNSVCLSVCLTSVVCNVDAPYSGG